MTDSRPRGASIRRRRRCDGCGVKWFTIEIDEEPTKRSIYGTPGFIPDAQDVVRFAFEERKKQGVTYDMWSKISRLSRNTLKRMRVHIPRTDTLAIALESLGCELIARRKPTTGKRKADGEE